MDFPPVTLSSALHSVKIGIAIPCYNEASRLPQQTFLDFAHKYPFITFLFVDDGSSDGTGEMLKNLAQKSSGIFSVLSLPTNSGKAEAVRQSVLQLSQNPDLHWIGFWDADLSTPLEEVIYMLEFSLYHKESKAIFGSRILRGGAIIQRSNFRHYISRVFASLRGWLLPFSIYDTQCGAKLIDRHLAKKLFASPFVSRWLFDVELLARLQHILPSDQWWSAILEVPLRNWVEIGKSKVRLVDIILQPYELLRIALHYRIAYKFLPR